MKITKQNETFNLTDTTEVFVMEGNIIRDNFGTLNIHFNVNAVGGDIVGDCHYNKYGDTATVNFSVNCSEENREALTVYADTVIDSVLEHFKSEE